MNNNLRNKLEQLLLRLDEIEILLADNAILSQQQKFRQLSVEHAEITPIANLFKEFKQAEQNINYAQEMLLEDNTELRQLAKEEIASNQSKIQDLIMKLQLSLLPQNKYDNRNIILEIRAGTGGDEASIFVGDLFKMYSRYVEKQEWQIKILNSNHNEYGGFKTIIAKISGSNVYSKLKFESGIHRVQRVPQTESQGRVHTSACTVAIMPEVKDITEVNINTEDLRIDTFRARGAGGQHVNKTDSAVRITHMPTGIAVECQDGRSQHKNKAQAMSILASHILSAKKQEQEQMQEQSRKMQVGSGDRSEKIRTYNYPQNRISDHRINLTLYKLSEVLNGNLNEIIDKLIFEQQIQKMATIDN